ASAPKNDRTPPITHPATIPAYHGTLRAITFGSTKMPEPITIPTTISVASSPPNSRGRARVVPPDAAMSATRSHRAETFARVLFHRVHVEFHSQSGAGRDGQHALTVQLPGRRHQIVDERRAHQVFHHIGFAAGRRQLQICRQSQRRVPPV